MMGGTTVQNTTENKELPKWYQEAAIDQINLGKRLGEIGAIPYMGPEVAAFAPQEVAGMQSSNDLAAAFGMPSVGNVSDALMTPTDFGGGLMGYSSFPGYEQVLADFSTAYPALASYLAQFSMDPITGEQAQYNPMQQIVESVAQDYGRGQYQGYQDSDPHGHGENTADV